MNYDEQFDFVAAMEEDCEVEREERIRKLAVDAATFTVPPGDRACFWPVANVPMRSYLGDGLGRPQTLSYSSIAVNIHPGIQGFARVLVAEEIIRTALGDK